MRDLVAGIAGSRHVRSAAIGAVTVCCLLFVAAPQALADSTWTGAAASGTTGWSNGSNWSGGTAPTAGSAGTLTFPALSSCNTSTETCYGSSNDLTGANLTGLTIDDKSSYSVTGNGITLGSGGISTTSTGSSISATWATPIALGADQTWSIGGGGQLVVAAAVTGASDTLNVALNNFSDLALDGVDEVGPITASGNGDLQVAGGSVNASDGNSIGITNGATLLAAANVTTGPVSVTGGILGLGGISTNTLTVNGAASLNSTSTTVTDLNATTASRLTASGSITLAGTLDLGWPLSSSCTTLTPGTVYTLVSSTGGSVSGTFANAADGSVHSVQCVGNTEGTVQIHYTSAAVTATVVATPNLSASASASGTVGSAISPSSVSAPWRPEPLPAGTVTFEVFGPQSSAPTDCTSGGTTVGTATVSGDGTYNPSSGFTPSDAGDYWWYASYNGDSDNTPAASTCGPSMAETVVAKASTSFTSGASPTATTYGNSVMLSATGLPSGATGTVIFTSGGNTLCSGTVSTGSASCSTGTLAPATYPVTATYSGDTNYQGSTSTTSFTISKATPSLTATAPANATVGSAISPSSVSAPWRPELSHGTVTFEVFGPQSSAPTDCTSGGTTVGTATVSGDGTYNPSSGFTPSDAGDYWWYASYNGDSDNTPAASTCGASMAETLVAPSPIPTPPTVSNVSISTSGSSSQSGPVVDPGIEVTCPGGGSSCSASEQATVMIGAANTPVESGPRVEHPMTLSSTQSTILAGGSSNAAFHLNQLGMRLLSDHKRLSVQITVSGYAHGATPVTATKTITLDGRFASYKVSAVKVYRDGTITLRVNLSTPGHVNVLVSAWNDNIAGEARVLNPSPGRFVVGRASTNTKKAGVLTLRVRPTAQGKRLIAHPAYPVTLRLWVSYIPLYAFQINRGDYGLHP